MQSREPHFNRTTADSVKNIIILYKHSGTYRFPYIQSKNKFVRFAKIEAVFLFFFFFFITLRV